jgi:hypothetical protein
VASAQSANRAPSLQIGRRDRQCIGGYYWE